MENTSDSKHVVRSEEYACYVYYEDTDFSGFVYHANYLKFFERAREHLIGIDYLRELYAEGVHFVVHSMNVRYVKPARHGDHLTIRTTCQIRPAASLIFEQKALSKDHELLVEAQIKVAVLNSENKPIRLSADVIRKLSA